MSEPEGEGQSGGFSLAAMTVIRLDTMVTISNVQSEFPASANYQALYRVAEPSVGLEAYIAIHSLSKGPGFGGIRRMPYPDAHRAVADVLRLSEHMTLKCALAELPCGGAKAVILDHPGINLDAAYQAFGQAVQTLDGAYYCGPDVGTGREQMAQVRANTRYANPPGNRPSESTALGVLYGIEALLAHQGTTLHSALVQGVGRVGSLVAQGLAKHTRGLAVSDTHAAAVETTLSQLIHGATVVTHESALDFPCTLLSPCAVGPVITTQNVNSLPVQMICGSANNQLELPVLADHLHKRGVLYVPDVVVNAGAVIEGVLSLLAPGDDLQERVAAKIGAIKGRVHQLLDESAAGDCAPFRIATGHAVT
jgi:leucine dehydrogenase